METESDGDYSRRPSVKLGTFLLAVKYWLSGDSWKKAVEYAKAR